MTTPFPEKEMGCWVEDRSVPAGQARALQLRQKPPGATPVKGHGFRGGACRYLAACSYVQRDCSSPALILNTYDKNNYTT